MGVGVGVAVGAGVGVAVGAGVRVGVGVGVAVGVGDGVAVGVGVTPGSYSYAPISNPAPFGRVTPSISYPGAPSDVPASIQGEFG